MRYSVAVSTFSDTKGMPVMVTCPSVEDLNYLKELNYCGVDLFVDDVSSDQTSIITNLLRSCDLKVGVVMPARLTKDNLFLGDQNIDIRKTAISKMKEIIRFSSTIGGMVSLGLIRGNVASNETLINFEYRLADSIRELVKTARDCNVKLLIEPINRYEINNINRLDEAIKFIRKYDLPISIMADTFHMNIEETNLEDSLRNSLPYIEHIHFVDSNRYAPSMGHTNLESLYKILLMEQYHGYLCLETLPTDNWKYCASCGSKFFSRMEMKYLKFKSI